jgi:hypothetical protein
MSTKKKAPTDVIRLELPVVFDLSIDDARKWVVENAISDLEDEIYGLAGYEESSPKINLKDVASNEEINKIFKTSGELHAKLLKELDEYIKDALTEFKNSIEVEDIYAEFGNKVIKLFIKQSAEFMNAKTRAKEQAMKALAKMNKLHTESCAKTLVELGYTVTAPGKGKPNGKKNKNPNENKPKPGTTKGK